MIIEPDIANSVMPAQAQMLFTALAGIPMLVVLCIAIMHVVRKGAPLLLYCFIGGGFASFFEPIADLLCGLYFPAVGQNTAFTTFGRPIPWALVFAYPWFVGGQGYLTSRMFERGVTRQKIWQLWGVFALCNIVLESPGVITGFHAYYGNQPFNFWGFPLWMAAVQSIMPIVAGAMIYGVRRHVQSGWKLLSVIPMIPMADGLVNAGLDIPIWSTLGSNLSLTANYIAALVTIGMAACAVWLIAITFGRTAEA